MGKPRDPKRSRQRPQVGPTVVLSSDEALYVRAVELLAQPKATYDAVASELGVDRRTLFTWRNDALFRFIESKMLDDTLGAARARLRVLVFRAVAVLEDALNCEASDRDDAAKWKVRLDAARAVLDRVGLKPETIRDVPLTDEELDAVAQKLGVPWLSSKASTDTEGASAH